MHHLRLLDASCIVAVSATVLLSACNSPNPVTVFIAGPHDIADRPGGLGTVSAAIDLPVFPGFRGQVLSISVEAGDHVTQGEPLLTVDPSALQISVAAIKARIQGTLALLAQAQLRLREAQVKHPNEIPAIQSTIAALQATIAVDQQLLASASGHSPVITSPIDGWILDINISQGQTTSSTLPLMDVVDFSNILVTATLPTLEQRYLADGQLATAKISNLSSVTLQGVVKAVGVGTVQGGSGVVVTVQAPNTTDQIVRPGMSAYITIDLTRRADLVVPIVAVLNMDTDPTVFVVRNNVAHMQRVALGVSDQKWVEVAHGISPGDAVVIVGNQSLDNGTKVTITATETSGTSTASSAR